MRTETKDTEENLSSGNDGYELSQNDMRNVYMKLSCTDDISFDEKQESLFIVSLIELLFDDDTLKIETKLLQADTNKINTCFAILIKSCFNENNFKKPGIIFIGFCDYFDLDYTKTYVQLHDKLKFLVEHNTKTLLGNKRYQKHKIKASQTKHGVDRITTLFDLL